VKLTPVAVSLAMPVISQNCGQFHADFRVETPGFIDAALSGIIEFDLAFSPARFCTLSSLL